jgi:2-dehydro-3-deoxyphosphooctonate aldolase (KDO 8-P synthase)
MQRALLGNRVRGAAHAYATPRRGVVSTDSQQEGDILSKKLNQILVGGGAGIAPISIGSGALVVIAGPCVIESEERTQGIARALHSICARVGLPLIFKASFDKANRTAIESYRGPGIEEGLRILGEIRRDLGVCVTTDVHRVEQVSPVAGVVDLLQIPAFLCRQTDLLVAAGASGRPVNIKKGQFQAPWDMGSAVEKVQRGGTAGVMLTERGTSFGYNNLVTDMRSLPQLAQLGVPVCFDATHSTQLPGADGRQSGGDREMAPVLARAAVAVGVDALFIEVHDEPERALSDAASQIRLSEVEALLNQLAAIHRTLPPRGSSSAS